MYTVRLSVQRINLIAAILIVSLGMLACNALTRFINPETASTSQPVAVETQSATSQNQVEVLELSGAEFTYDGDFNGVKYQLDLPVEFIHSTSGGWQEFCLDTPEKLCVGIQPQNGNWNDAEALANEVIIGFGSTVGNYLELDHKSTFSGDGFPAFWVAYTYTWQDKDLEGARLFVVVQHVGFDIAAEGTPALMDEFRSVLEKIVDSFRLDYN